MIEDKDLESTEPRVDRHDRSGSMQLHVPSGWDEASVLSFAMANAHPSIAKQGYRIRGADDPRLNGTPARDACLTHEGFDHVIVDPVGSPVPMVFTLTQEEREAIKQIILRRPGYTKEAAKVARELWWGEIGLRRGFDPETLGPYTAETFYADPLTDERRVELEKELEIVRSWIDLPREFDQHGAYDELVHPLIVKACAEMDRLGLPYVFDVVTARIDGKEGEVVQGHTLVRLPPTRAMKWQRKAGETVIEKQTRSNPLAELFGDLDR